MIAIAIATLMFCWWGFKFVSSIEEGYQEKLLMNLLEKQQQREQEIQVGDYWDGEEVNYDTGEVGANARPSVRHPKNRDRAYAGSAERFHDGGGQDS